MLAQNVDQNTVATLFLAVAAQVTTNWKDMDDLAGGRAQGLDGVGTAATK